MRLRAGDASTLDSRGFVYLKLGRLDDAVADFDAALKLSPKLAGSLYARGVVKLKQGSAAAGNADIAAAKLLQADIAEDYARFGVPVP